MKIEVKDKKLKAALEDEALCQRRYGADMAKKIGVRVASLAAAQSLHVFWPPFSRPERCHELQGDRKGTFSMDLVHPFRLLFKGLAIPQLSPKETDEQARWKSIDAIEIVGIEDTHG